MQLIDFLKSLPDESARERFAASCKTTIKHLRNVSYGCSPCSTELAVLIEKNSDRQVTRKDVCPKTWKARWPELVTQCPTAAAGRRWDHSVAEKVPAEIDRREELRLRKLAAGRPG